eukprot:m.49733 g.49733  ORF g.49733 m.49733 type:complete len:845 (+) comp17946_c0_seq3:46-2580(+)
MNGHTAQKGQRQIPACPLRAARQLPKVPTRQFSLSKSLSIDPEESEEEFQTNPDFTPLTDGVFYHIKTVGRGVEFFVKNTRSLVANIVLDLSGSKNIAFPKSNLKHSAVVNPGTRKRVGRAKEVVKNQGFTFHVRFHVTLNSPGIDYQKELKAQELAKVDQAMKALTDFDMTENVPVEKVKALCKKHKIHYVDEEFPPADESLFSDHDRVQDDRVISWRRAQDLLGEASIVSDGIDPNDIKQGILGDCWLLCALAALAEFPDLIRRAFLNASNSAGVYDIVLYPEGQRQVFRLDDYFPCTPGEGPVYARNVGPELWVMLLEKAYAKARGQYSRLDGGLPYYAFLDLTGFPAVRYDLKKMKDDPELWDKIKLYDDCNLVMCASVPGEDVFTHKGKSPAGGPGLVSGHAYSLIQAKSTSSGHKLLNLRNPWGRFEWNGDWSDSSPLWTAELREELKVSTADDGLFWMSFEDFLKYFASLNVCFSHTNTGEEWQDAIRVKGAFQCNDITVGVNPSTQAVEEQVAAPVYELLVTESTDLWIGLHQEDRKKAWSHPYIPLGAVVTKIDSGEEVFIDAKCCNDREIFLHLDLEPGTYKLTPVSPGKFHEEDSFSRHSDAEIRLQDDDKEFTEHGLNVINEVFRRFDKNMDSLLTREELETCFKAGDVELLDDDEYEAAIYEYDSVNDCLTFSGFSDLLIQQGDKIRSMLQNLGYDDKLRLTRSRAFVITIHSDQPVELNQTENSSAEAVRSAFLNWTLAKGQKFALSDDLAVHTLNYAYGWTTACTNTTKIDVLFTLDSKKSQNVQASRGQLCQQVCVKSGETKFVSHFVPTPLAKMRSWSWSARCCVFQ